ncbi:hypothetical protein BT69DRAFT_1376844 [Atractiella rhizophila]|nr:hypothetical protein BT69DRAFT_1376844 [Atractiella rhizophila]
MEAEETKYLWSGQGIRKQKESSTTKKEPLGRGDESGEHPYVSEKKEKPVATTKNEIAKPSSFGKIHNPLHRGKGGQNKDSFDSARSNTQQGSNPIQDTQSQPTAIANQIPELAEPHMHARFNQLPPHPPSPLAASNRAVHEDEGGLVDTEEQKHIAQSYKLLQQPTMRATKEQEARVLRRWTRGKLFRLTIEIENDQSGPMDEYTIGRAIINEGAT